MEKVNIDPFSSGTEHDIWATRNCDRCVKASRYKGKTWEGGVEYTQCRCAIQRDILTRMISNKPIAKRTIDICRMRDCPYRQEHHKKYEKYKREPKLFE